VRTVKERGREFIDTWSAHGAKLNAAFEIFHNYFIAIFVDEEQARASGCSIDKSVRFIKKLEMDFELSLLDRNLISYMDSGTIRQCSRGEFVLSFQSEEINEETVVFNNLVKTKGEFANKWQVPLKKSWHYEMVKQGTPSE
jgi:hypothetical protein